MDSKSEERKKIINDFIIDLEEVALKHDTVIVREHATAIGTLVQVLINPNFSRGDVLEALLPLIPDNAGEALQHFNEHFTIMDNFVDEEIRIDVKVHEPEALRKHINQSLKKLLPRIEGGYCRIQIIKPLSKH